jgi:site-specific DNA recombinase
MRRTTGSKRFNGKTIVRCAIYTRKSSEEGLEQEFNSLDAQREACEAFILSQKHEGWVALPEMYDDGGISGATMDRPALTRLLDDIRAHRIDTVVVYKIDRLTRSLFDFARIMETFDAGNVSFVAVTQQFNTTTSMGRLTLNMLLSFAQFEREVTSERIRDKIAASKKKGLWMGGNPPLGYDARDKQLVVNEHEAATVRHIYNRYVELGSVRELKVELECEGIMSKVRMDGYGRLTGGKPLSRGALYLMLQNRIYRGEIVHKDESYPGQHRAIIDEDLWEAVQAKLAEGRVERETRDDRVTARSLLTGLVYDDAGQRMTPSHANKRGRRYRYYVSRSLVTGDRHSNPNGRRVPAKDLERLVEERIRTFLADGGAVHDALADLVADASAQVRLMERAADIGAEWASMSTEQRRSILRRIVSQVVLERETLDIRMRPVRLVHVLDEVGEVGAAEMVGDDETAPTLTLTVPARLRRTGLEKRLLIEGAGGGPRGKADPSLLKLLAKAQELQTTFLRGNASMTEMAQAAGMTGSYFTRILRLSFLAPEITKTILRGRQPIGFNARKLMADSRLPLRWDEQHTKLGFD